MITFITQLKQKQGTGYEKNWIDVSRFGRDVKQVLTPGEWIHKFKCTDYGRCDRGHNFGISFANFI